MYACVLSHVRLFAALQTVAVQAHGLLQARILEGGAISSSRGSPWPRDRAHISCVSCIAGGLFTPEPPGKPAVRIEGDWEVGRRTSLSDMGRSNCGRSGWTLHNKWPQALWRWDSDRCYVHKWVTKPYGTQQGGLGSHLGRLECLGRPEAGAGTVCLLPHPDKCYLGWMAWRMGSLGRLSGVSTCGFSPCPGFSLHGTGFRPPRGSSLTRKTLFQKTQGPFHHTAWPKPLQACPDLRGKDTVSVPWWDESQRSCDLFPFAHTDLSTKA